jgi:hypothetical protein
MKKYTHKDQFSPLDYVQHFNERIARLSDFEQEDIRHSKGLIVNQVPNLGSVLADELLLKLGSFLNGVNDGKESGRSGI